MNDDARDVTLTSTTETPEEMSAALGIPADGDPDAQGVSARSTVADPAAVPEGGTKTPEGGAKEAEKTADADTDDAADDDADVTPPKTAAAKKSDREARDARLNFERMQAIRAATTLAEENAALKEQLRTAKPAASKVDDSAAAAAAPVSTFAQPKPDIANFETVEAWTEALSDWTMAKVRHDISTDSRATVEAERQQREQEATYTAHEARVTAFRDAHPDFDEVKEQALAQKLPMTAPMIAHIQNSPEGPALAYHLAKNGDECRRIAALPYGPALVAMGELQYQLRTAAATTTATVNTPAKPAKPAPVAPPAPIEPVGSGPTKTVKSADEMTQREWNEYRAAGGGRR